MYAKYLQDEQQAGHSRGRLTQQLLMVLLGATSIFSLIIGNLVSSGLALQMSLIGWGFV